MKADEIQSTKLPFYIGTYTGGISQGVYRSALDPISGQLDKPELVAEVTNPSFLTVHRNQTALYVVSEVGAGDDQDAKQVFAYRIKPNGQLVLLNSQATLGDGPCYISTDATGRYAFVANYGSGSITSFAIKADGSLSEPLSHVQHTGHSITKRQSSPHAHCIVLDPSNKFACVADLGLDQILVYENASGRLSLNETNFKVKPGSGPRHLAFHPDGKHAFVILEMNSTLSSLGWDAAEGKFEHLSTLSTLPEGHSGSNSTAEVLVHPNGKFVYGSNRGHDSIACFAFDSADGRLTPIGHTPTGGRTPRNFRIDPTGKFLLTENQNSDSIHIFRIDQKSGELSKIDHSIEVGSPCCIRFISGR